MIRLNWGPHEFGQDSFWYIALPQYGGDIRAQFEASHESHDEEETTDLYLRVRKTLNDVVALIAAEKDESTHYNLSFVNYGSEALIFRLMSLTGELTTIVINQPCQPPEKLITKFEGLKRLHAQDHRFVIRPDTLYSTSDADFNAYTAEYFPSAKCPAYSDQHQSFGIYDPDPKYRFIPFSKERADRIKTSQIAVLVNYYDEERQQGLGSVYASGSDFLLAEEVKFDDPDSVLNSLRLISPRGFISIPRDEYLELLREEFSTGNKKINPNFQINQKNGEAFPLDVIDTGIALGAKLAQERIL